MMHVQLKFHEVMIITYFVMAYFIDLNQFKGNNSCINEASQMKIYVHSCVIMIYIQF